MMTLFLTYELKVAVLIAVFYIFWRLLVPMRPGIG